jgi:hypothetical protein
MPLLGDPWASKEGPWASTDHIPGKTGSTVYDRDGLEWVRDTSEMISWGCPARGIRSDHGAVFGPFTAEPPPAPDYIYNSGPYPRPTTEREENMATSLTADRKVLKAQAAELARQLAEVQKGLENLVPDEPAGAGAVIRFKKFRQAYTYAALRVGEQWYLTQNPARPQDRKLPMYWEELVSWIGESNWDTIEVLS